MRAARRDEIIALFGEELTSQLEALTGVYVSLSGGVDSSAVLALMAGLLPPDRLQALHFSSFLHPAREGRRAAELCRALGLTLTELQGPELEQEGVMTNHPHRCALCKGTRLQHVEGLVRQKGWTIVDGTNATDKKDPTRLGNQVLAGCDFLISPFALAGLEKEDVRQLAQRLGIDWAQERATACMATRFPRGVRLTEEECRRVACAEEALEKAGISVRLRVFGEAVCLEFTPPFDFGALPLAQVREILKAQGYKRIMVDLDGYQTGREWLEKLWEVLDV